MLPDRESRIATAMLTLIVACFGIADVAHADGTGYFTSDQVTQGRLAYAADCATCHGASLQGGGAPALGGRGFALEWSGKSLQDFYGFVHKEMPLGRAGTLRDQTYADIVSYILSENGIAPGDEKLTPTTPMQRALTLGASTGKGAVATTPPTKFVMGALTGEVRQPTTHAPTQAELDRADDATDNWLMYNKGYRGARYSTLARIDTKNVGAIKPVCLYQTGELGTFSTGPVVYDGILYATTHLGTYAIDATTCKKLWVHHHIAQGPEMNATNKGVAIAGGRVIRGTQDGFLYALDAKTGDVLWTRQVADWSVGEGIGAAPIVWNDIVYVGKAGGDWGIQGRMMAFHVEDGSLAWSFNLIPRPGEQNADTWENRASAEHGGGAAWVHYALDRDTGTLFIPVGNPAPDFNVAMRPGANLYTISTVALDAKTGKLKWWYQLRANDQHDYDATTAMLFDANGKKLVATAGKEGILHVVSRDDGKLVFKLPVTTVLNHDVPLTPEGVRVCPVAGVQWNGPAFSPQTSLLYVNAIDWCTLFKLGPDPKWQATIPYTGLLNGYGTNDPISEWAGWINAVDPKTGAMKWRKKWPTPMYAAVTPTAGGVLFTGDLDGNFLAFDASDGNELYRFDTGGPIAGGIVTYERGGKQYVAVATGHSGGSIPLNGAAMIAIFGQ